MQLMVNNLPSSQNANPLSPFFAKLCVYISTSQFSLRALLVVFQCRRLLSQSSRHELNRLYLALRFVLYAVHLSPFILNCAFMSFFQPYRSSFHLFERIRTVNLCELQSVIVSTITVSINIPHLLFSRSTVRYMRQLVYTGYPAIGRQCKVLFFISWKVGFSSSHSRRYYSSIPPNLSLIFTFSSF